MINRLIFFMYIALILSSCTRDLDFSPPYEGDKLVINGYLSPNEGAKIKITHSINPVGIRLFADSLLVKDAVASIYENNVKLVDLKYLGKGFYGLPASPVIDLLAGHSYKLMVQSEQYGKVESEEISLPEQPVINDFKSEEIVEIYHQENSLFSFSITEPSNKETCFSVDVVTKDNESLYFWNYPRIEGETVFESCEVYVGDYGGSMIVYSNECGFTNQVHKYATGIKYYNGHSIVYYKPLMVKISTVSRELFDYAKSYRKMAGLELGFSEPPILKSNIKGGFGLFYGLNSVSYDISRQEHF